MNNITEKEILEDIEVKNVVYKYTNLVNDKVYIGITSRGIETRHREHLTQNKNNIFNMALRKYGIENFNLEVIDTADSYEELQAKEMHYAKKFNSFVGFKNSHGYNMTLGGDGTIGFSHSIETRKKISKQKKLLYKDTPHPALGVPVSEETKEKQRKFMAGRYAGNKNPYFGKTHSDNVRKKMSDKWHERYRKGFHNREGAVLSDETKKLISESQKGKVISEEHRRKISEKVSGEKNANALKVRCITTNEVFNYMGEASKKYNLDRSNLTKNCKGKTKWCGIHPVTGDKLKWEYVH